MAGNRKKRKADSGPPAGSAPASVPTPPRWADGPDFPMKPRPAGRRRALRQRAERALRGKPTVPSAESMEGVLHELHVHQVELEMQVEELRRAEDELQRMRDRYVSLYDEAPVGYVTLSKYNLITQANRAAARILGTPKSSLISRRFSSFLDDASRATFFRLISEARRSGARPTFDAAFTRPEGRPSWVKLDFSAVPDTGELRIALVDISERRAAEAQLRALADGLIKLQEKERKAVAEALHDDAGQQLTYLTILLDRAREAADRPDPGTLDQLSQVTRKILRTIRTLSASLSPAELSRFGLGGAIQGMISEFTERTRIPVSFSAAGIRETHSFEVSLAVYRIAQEALTNAARHAQPRSVNVTMRGEAGRLMVKVEDDGKGFNVEDCHLSLGLLSMRERARAVGGKLDVLSAPGQGTSVVFVLPAERHRGLTA